jgi:beta-glucanase (GH16 family)
MQKIFYFLTAGIILTGYSCSKSGGSGAGSVAPANLTVSAVVSTDNSGNVSFTASATNAITYDFDYGNGIYQTVAGGVVTYKYPASGTYTVNVIAKSSSGQTISKSIQVTVAVSQSLVWSDEFNVAGAPDPAKWGYDIGTGSGGWGNNELEYYTNRPENVIISGGTLKITAKAEAYSGSTYTSARMLTKDKFSFKYGKVEFSAKLPTGAGTWPAVWSLGNNFITAPWPACGEIDFMEHVGNQQNKIFSTLHHPGHSGGNGDGGTVVISNASTAFHKYTTEWTAATIKFSVDDVPFYTFPNTASLPFNQNFFIIMNVAMGGNFGGPVDPAFVSSTLEVDYIRVYQ